MSALISQHLQRALFQRMERLASSLSGTDLKAKSSSLVGIRLLSDLTYVKSSKTPPSASSSLDEVSSVTIEANRYKIIEEASTTTVRDTVLKNVGPNSSYLVMRSKNPVGTSTESEPTSSSSSGQDSDIFTKTLVFHSVAITPERMDVLEKVDPEEIRLKHCTIESGTLDLLQFTGLKRLHISLDPYSQCSIILPSCLQELIVYVNPFDSAKSDLGGYYTYIDAERCVSLGHMWVLRASLVTHSLHVI
jgi:hypothetical protein